MVRVQFADCFNFHYDCFPLWSSLRNETPSSSCSSLDCLKLILHGISYDGLRNLSELTPCAAAGWENEDETAMIVWNTSPEIEQEGIVLSSASGTQLQRLSQVCHRCIAEPSPFVHQGCWMVNDLT